MSRKGNCWDNAVAESFFHTLKSELVYCDHFKNQEEAKAKIMWYIKGDIANLSLSVKISLIRIMESAVKHGVMR